MSAPLTLAVRQTENRGMRPPVAARYSTAFACLAVLLGLAVLRPAQPLAAQDPRPDDRLRSAAVEALAPGKLLVAARRLPDPNFANAVILLADFNGEGAVGLVLNRQSDLKVARVFPNLTATLVTAGQAFLGGPVEKTRPMALVRATSAPAGARHVLDGVYLLIPRESIEAALASSTTSSHIRIYLGYAGWSPGQLEAETAEGVWHVLAADADAVFDADPSSTWQRQIARTDVIQARAGKEIPWPLQR
jgi:putative transcriptional regulator